jgi:DNA modification methylase
MTDQPKFSIPLATDRDIAAFIARYGTPYDPETDDYHREPFIADTREGKNDSIYNAHSYHTKVPPRAIIPYILHYTEPGDIILDPFCGSGMTGVAATLCEDPPDDLLKIVAGAKKGTRRVILNDLSPAACHIAYNYCTPIDLNAVKAECERITNVVKDEMDWLYGTEHYEPAVGRYDAKDPNVLRRLKDPPRGISTGDLLPLPLDQRTWELLDRAEVETRIGPDALAQQPLLEGAEQFIRIPATIQYTIWSDVYKCQGMVTVEEPTGRTNKRTGQPTMKKVRRPRGCGATIVLWHAAVDSGTGDVKSRFCCPTCGSTWEKSQLARIGELPVLSRYAYFGLAKAGHDSSLKMSYNQRPTTARERARLEEIGAKPIPYWYPDHEMDRAGPRYRRDALSVRQVFRVCDFYTRRNLWSQSRLWAEFNSGRQSGALAFLFTALTNGMTRRSAYLPRETARAKPVMKGSLYIPSFSAEWNPIPALATRLRMLETAFSEWHPDEENRRILNGDAAELPLPEGCVDYIFTDPPFGSNIYYSEMSVLWEAWLGQFTDRQREAVVHRKNDGGFKRLPDYQATMTKAFREMARVLKPGRHATVEFNNSDGEVFEAIKKAVRDAGFIIANMVFLDKVQKTFIQIRGDKGVADVVGHDVIFNLHKPDVPHSAKRGKSCIESDHDSLEHTVAQTVRDHLRGLPQRIEADPQTYNDEHRSTPFLNTMLMNALIPRGVNVERLNLPFIEAICARYFRKLDNRWFLRDEVVSATNGKNDGGLFSPYDVDVAVSDETTAIAWLTQRLGQTPMRIGELRPHWMRATVMLTSDISTRLDQYLLEHFWFDRKTHRWRIPTDEERAQMDDTERRQARFDAERYMAGTLRRHPADSEVLNWIEHLYHLASRMEEESLGLVENGQEAELPEEAATLYAMMPRLLQGVLKENVEARGYSLAQRHCRIASTKLAALADEVRDAEQKAEIRTRRPLFEGLDEDE